MPSEIKSPGGLSFELVWEKPTKDLSKVLNSPPSKDDINIESRIKEKQTAAEERRRSMESSRLEQWQKNQQRTLERKSKVEELDKQFKQVSGEKLTEKITKVEEKKKACQKNLMLRLHEHEERAKKVRERKKVIGENGDSSPTSS